MKIIFYKLRNFSFDKSDLDISIDEDVLKSLVKRISINLLLKMIILINHSIYRRYNNK